MTTFEIYCIVALIFGAFYGFQLMKPYYAQYTGQNRVQNRSQRVMIAAKLGGAYMIAWLASSVLMPIAVAEALYKTILKYDKKRKTK
jgi:hypothetical protein